jgi:hypothetical protein
MIRALVDECDFRLEALELPGARNLGDWEFGCASRSTSGFRHSFNARQIFLFAGRAGRNWIERLLVSFIDNHTPKCREVVRLSLQSMEVKLPITTRIGIRS